MGDADKLTRYQKQMKSKQGQSAVRLQGQLEKKVGGTRERGERTEIRLNGDKIDSIFGFDRMKEGLPRVGWLLNYLPITMPDETGIEKSGMDLYFIERGAEVDGGGGNFKATVFFEPYLYLDVSDPRRMMEIANHLLKRFEGCKVQPVEREDLDLPNHLSGKKHPFLKLSFGTVSELMDAKSQLRPIITANQKRLASAEDYLFSGNNDDALVSYLGNNNGGGDIWEDTTTTTNSAAAIVSSRTAGSTGTSVNAAAAAAIATDPLSYLIDFREHDVPYGVRASIDLDLRIGAWYKVTPEYGSECCVVQKQAEILELCEPRILAFDIECEKSPLKFPNAEVDRIFMISYMVKNQGFLIINRDVVSEDIEDFEYTPKPTFPGPFKVFNEKDEEAVLRKFVSHIQELKPHVIVTYNGDKFDWPYVETRCKKYTYLNLYSHLGIRSTAQPAATVNKDGTPVAAALFSDNEYTGRCMIHLDAFCWVQRDSYLPQGNQGLKAVTKYKLGYDPVEVDPEDMLRFARERPHHMASYSVSDAVATYYLYTTYVHNFIFSLSTIIPMGGEDVLRKGSGTLCEMLLMVEAYNGNIVCPNKQVDPLESFHEGHLLESETYIGGHVECLEAGVFRADIPAKFNLVPSALQQLINNIDRDLTFTLEVEHGLQRSDAVNYDEVRQQIVTKLEMLRDSPHREESPIIYHLDVGAMYPNIILTNRLQPSAMVSTSDCASCVYNKAENQCKRPMTWTWRGDFSPTSFSEYQSVKRQLEYERINTNPNNNNNYNKNNASAGVGGGNLNVRTFSELSEREQTALIRTRLKAYSSRVYRKTKVTSVEQRTDTVCMRENSFYVDTVKAFRDRRYDYKLFTKEWKNKKVSADKKGDAVARKVAEDMETLMDSLQLAHKCILNSFYGYVMRKGARWRSMEMAGIVTHTGAALIKQARELVEQVGRPLELDTDGIWCILPTSFPQDFKIKMRDGSNVSVGYPCAMLNADVHENYTNHQYQELQKTDNKSIKYATHSECSIFFELDGPYKAMVLPASPEEGKLLKKKYVVFNFNGTIAELKGFELKRRGELELVKIFQSQVFEHFLAGDTLSECYSAVGAIANQWLDVLDEQGTSMDDEELLELISERKTISKTVEDYEGRKSTSLTTAARLADFLGADMVRDKGLNCNLVISRLPAGAPVTERAIPVAIFSCESTIRKFFLRKWLKDSSLECDDFRHLIDWNYYKERLGKSIQKIITIPAGLQRIGNPCPRVEHPVWLTRSIQERNSGRKQLSILNSFSNMRVANEAAAAAKAASTAIAAPRLLSAGADRPVKSILTAGDNYMSGSGNNKQPKKRVRILLEGEELPEEEEDVQQQQQDAHSVQDIGDMEDFGSRSPGGTVSKTGLVRVTNHRTSTSATVSASDAANDAANDSAEGTSAESADSSASAEEDLAAKVSIIALNELPNGHATTAEFNTWLADRKSRWAKTRALKKAQRAELARYGANRGTTSNSGMSAGPLVKKNVGVADFVRNASLAASMGFWQVIEIQETDIAGEFVVWAMTAPTQLQRLNVVIPRILYVNVTAAGKDAQAAAVGLGGIRIRKDLPHGKQCRELFEVSIPERKFQRNERALNLFLCDAQVEGVYESQVPLWLRGILGMGCVSTVNSRASNTNSRYYKLQDIDLVHTQSHPYLTHHTAHYRRIYIYYAADRTRVSGDVGIVALFQLESSNYEQLQLETTLLQQRLESIPHHTGHVASDLQAVPLSGKAYVWLVSRGANLEKAPFKRIYRKFQPSETADVKFVQNYVTTLSQAWSLCNERLTLYQRERHGPTIVIVQGGASTDASSSPSNANNSAYNSNNSTKVSNTASTSGVGMDARQWRHVLPSLHDYPLAVMPANSLDSLFPAIGWQLFCAERMVQRFLIFPRWFDDRLTAARYAHIPLCNLGSDALTTMIDVTFSRQLLHNRHVLWCSEGTGPDLGKGNSTNELLDIWSEALKEPVINVPGAYRGACVELDLYGLAVCAIMSSGELDAEGLTTLALAGGGGSAGAGGAVGQSTGHASADSDDEDGDNHHSNSHSNHNNAASAAEEGHINVLLEGIENTSDASCARAFNIFKAMIAKCIEEVSSSPPPSTNHTSTATDGTAGIADSILTAVYRYLCGYGNGLLSDPLLHRVIYGLMTKLFQKLVGGLRRLGTKVVYADFGRIIISTDKHDFASAREYVEFILSALGNKPTFAYLQVSVKAYWEQMCWLGPENWGALPLTVPTATTDTADTANSIDVDTEGVDINTPADVSGDNDTSGDGDGEVEEVNQTGVIRDRLVDAVEEDTEEDESDAEPSATAVSPVKKVPSMFTNNKGKNSAEKSSNDKSKNSKQDKEEEEGEFDFLDDINNSGSDRLSGGNLASIKQFFGHKGGNNSASVSAKTSGKKSKTSKYASSKHSTSKDSGVTTKHHKHRHSSGYSSGENSDSDLEEGGYGNSARYDQDYGTDYVDQSFESDMESQPDNEGDNSHNSNNQLQAHWNLATYLPDAAAEFFHWVIEEYLQQYKAKREQLLLIRQHALNSHDSGTFNIGSNSDGAAGSEGEEGGVTSVTLNRQVSESSELSSLYTEVLLDDGGIDRKVSEYMQSLLRERFTNKMLEIVDELQVAYSHHDLVRGAGSVFPVRAGSHLQLTSPALEFVKAATHVMALDPLLAQEVASLRRLLLTQLRVREFSVDSVFQDPCLSYTLRDVICSYCSTCRDLDLLRDASLTCEDPAQRWRCRHCQNRINTEEVENRLLEAVDKLNASYLLQDFRCRSSHRVSRRLGTAVSDLCDPLVMDVSREEALNRLKVLRQVANFHKFSLLKTAVEELMV